MKTALLKGETGHRGDRYELHQPLASREISEALKAKGIDMLDAPVSGGEPKAIDGTLSVMVGGDKAIFDKYYDLMKAMAGSVVHTGDIGAGNVTKLANQ